MWILFVPSIEILINPIICINSSFLYTNCVTNSAIMMIFSLISIFFLIFIEFLTIYIIRDYSFHNLSNLKLTYSFFILLYEILRLSIVIVKIFLVDPEIFQFLTVFALIMFSFINYLMNFPIRSPYINKTYLTMILFSFLCTIILTSIRLSIGFFSDSAAFYIFLVFSSFIIKLSLKIQAYFHIKHTYIGDFTIKNHGFGYIFEELLVLYDRYSSSYEGHYLFIGVLRNHIKYCKDPACSLTKKQLINVSNSTLQEISIILQKFMISRFKANLLTKSCFIEPFAIKYISFLLQNPNISSIQAYLEIQKIRMKFKFNDFALAAWIDLFLDRIDGRLIDFDIQRKFTQNNNSQNTLVLQVKQVFNSLRVQSQLQEALIAILKLKSSFYEKYIEGGFLSYDSLSMNIERYVKKYVKFQVKIKRNFDNKSIFYHKFMSISHGILINQLNISNDFEELDSNFRNKLVKYDKMLLSPLIFLNSDFITIQANFLDSEGIIEPHSKTLQLAKFFNYSPSQIESLYDIVPLFPTIIFGRKHRELVHFCLKRTRQEALKASNELMNFAKDADGFIFPVKLFNSHYFQRNQKFLLIAGMMKIDNLALGNLLVDYDGSFLGLSKDFYKIVTEEVKNVTVQDMLYMNIFSFSPKLEEIIQNINSEQGFLRGISLNIDFPKGNFNEILAVIKAKRIFEEQHIDSKSRSARSFKSYKSVKSENSHKTMNIQGFLRDITGKSLLSTEKKNVLLSKFSNIDNISEKELIICMMQHEEYFTLKAIVDIEIKKYRYSNEKDGIFQIISISIHKILKNNRVTDIHSQASEASKALNLQLPPENIVEFRLEFERNALGNTLRSKEETLEMKSHVTSYENKGFTIPKVQRIESNIDESSNIKKIEEFTDEKFMKNEEKKSNNASSISSIKHNLLISGIIIEIQNRIPRILKFSIISFSLQKLLLIIFAILLYLLSVLYIDNYYIPLQKGSLNQSRFLNNLCLSTLILNEFQYFSLNLTQLTLIQQTQLIELLNSSYMDNLALYHSERDIEFDFNYLKEFKEGIVNYVDYPTISMKTTIFPDFLQMILLITHEVLNTPMEKLVKTEELTVLPRNFPYFAMEIRKIREIAQSEFLTGGTIISQTVVIFLALCISMGGVLKICEFLGYKRYRFLLTRLLNIFLRTSIREAMIEIAFLKEMINLFENPENRYISINFAEKCMNKAQMNREYKLEEKTDNFQKKTDNIQKKNNNSLHLKRKHEGLKRSMFNLKPFSPLKSMIFLTFFTLLFSGFLITNYLLWSVTNTNIERLIQINVLFANLYGYSGALIAYEVLAIREQIIKESDYETLQDQYQNYMSRMAYFSSTYNLRKSSIEDIMNQIPKYALVEESSINDISFDEVIRGDACHALWYTGKIDENLLQLCRKVLEGALEKGIMSALNKYITFVTDKEHLMIQQNETNEDFIRQVKENVASEDSFDSIFSEFFVSKSALLLYDFLNTFYTNDLLQQYQNLKIVIWISCVFIITCMGFMTWKGFKSMLKKYKAISVGAFGFIPYEKLAGDEQTNFLIKQFRKQFAE